VLIVDDELINVELLKAFLVGLADETLGLTDSHQVETAFAKVKPDIVLLDLRMPETDSKSSADWAVRAKALAICRSSYYRRHLKARSQRHFHPGADDFISKPLDRQEVVLRVRNLLRTRNLSKEARGNDESRERVQLTVRNPLGRGCRHLVPRKSVTSL